MRSATTRQGYGVSAGKESWRCIASIRIGVREIFVYRPASDVFDKIIMNIRNTEISSGFKKITFDYCYVLIDIIHINVRILLLIFHLTPK